MSESYGITLVPPGGVRPLGYTFAFTLRAPGDPLLTVETRFDSPKAASVTVAGLPGHQLQLYDGQIGFAAMAGTDGGGTGWGQQITVEYYDERSDFGSDPMPEPRATALWPAVLGSIRMGR